MDLRFRWLERLGRFLATFMFACFICPAQADLRDHDSDRALYELGLAGATFFMQDYPASNQGKLRALVVPFVYYRGRVLRADDEGGIRGRFVERERMELDLSAAAGFPADSRDNHARRGMPNIDWIGEVGPRLRVHLYDEAAHRVDFNLPVRYVFSTDFKRVDDRGYLFQPQLEYRNNDVFGENWEASLLISMIFASDQLMDYFYEVSEEFATLERPSYQAEGGYLGSSLTLGASRKVAEDFKFFCGVKGDYYGFSTNYKSPLFKQTSNVSFAFGFSYVIKESEERAGTSL
ncbi:MAG: MipA/OmpV family protein [Bdellovibrionales bacterium]|nr:MipA/OmpV family protein [Bdellovibrionales bacterium]